MLLPASTGSGESDLVSARLAEVLTVVSSVAVLSEVSGSNTPEVVLAVLEMFVVRSEEHTSELQSPWNAACRILLEIHPTTPALRVPPPVAETKLVPAGIASDMLTPVASDGFFFFNDTATTEIYTLSLHDALPILVSARLAEVLTVVSSVAVLSEVSGSNTPEVVLAVLEMFVV